MTLQVSDLVPVACGTFSMPTNYHTKYWASELTLRGLGGSTEALSRSLAGARVDLNLHQVDAALFALRLPMSKGVVLADEVGLGKTIEAEIVIAQDWGRTGKCGQINVESASYG